MWPGNVVLGAKTAQRIVLGTNRELAGLRRLGFSLIVHGERGLAYKDALRPLPNRTRPKVRLLDVHGRETRPDHEFASRFLQQQFSRTADLVQKSRHRGHKHDS